MKHENVMHLKSFLPLLIKEIIKIFCEKLALLRKRDLHLHH